MCCVSKIEAMDKNRPDKSPAESQMRKARILAHLPNFVKLYWRLFRDPRVGWLPKLVLVAGIAYFLVPSDLLPDFLAPLAGLGLVDDAVVVYFAVKGFIRLCPRTVVEEHVHLIDQGG